MLRLALRLSHEMPWSPRLVVGVVSLGWACVSCVCAAVMWAQDTQPHDFDPPPIHEQALKPPARTFLKRVQPSTRDVCCSKGAPPSPLPTCRASPATPTCIPKRSAVWPDHGFRGAPGTKRAQSAGQQSARHDHAAWRARLRIGCETRAHDPTYTGTRKRRDAPPDSADGESWGQRRCRVTGHQL